MESGISNKLLASVALICFGMLFMLYIIIKQHQTIVRLNSTVVVQPVEVLRYNDKIECPSEDEVIAKVTTGSMLKYFLKDVE